VEVLLSTLLDTLRQKI